MRSTQPPSLSVIDMVYLITSVSCDMLFPTPFKETILEDHANMTGSQGKTDKVPLESPVVMYVSLE